MKFNIQTIDKICLINKIKFKYYGYCKKQYFIRKYKYYLEKNIVFVNFL